MGVVAPAPGVDPADAARWTHALCGPVLAELARRGTPFRGVLFAGVMLTPDGPRVIEFNCRFGDPECQALMTLLDEDLLPWLYGCAAGSAPAGAPRFRAGAACCVVLASRGYPEGAEKGTPIREPAAADGVIVFHAGTRRDESGVLRTNGGRVLGVTAAGADLDEARARAYAAVPGWAFDGAQWRTDIGVGR